MPELPDSTPLDLTRYSEATRRSLYDQIVEIQFTPEDPESAKHPEDVWNPKQTPDEAGLTVFFLLGVGSPSGATFRSPGCRSGV